MKSSNNISGEIYSGDPQNESDKWLNLKFSFDKPKSDSFILPSISTRTFSGFKRY